ncbi:MAG TPA: cytochrome c-type biogenesis protein [Longimicrobiales bacterium]|nr:cytochrome c-type biogenesis protein [Longimicrobiales bacterium]
MKRRTFAVLVIAGALAMLPFSLNAQGVVEETRIDRQVKELAAELRCPVCQGLSLQDSPSELAQEMRAVIRQQLVAGSTPLQVKQYFVSKYGEWILLEPEAHGFNLVAYILPIVGLLGGGVLIYFLLRRWVQPATAPDQRFDDEELEATG